MCGILGAFGRLAPAIEPRFQRALDTIAHRGPDGQGVRRFAQALLGHRRLAIIDTSEAGLQPMEDPDSGLTIVFNGEIYNYIELRGELEALGHRFRTRTDTECLLKGYAQWGPGLLARCNGMWAFAIWDERRGHAFLARDRFGVKPLIYNLSERGLMFASEPKALHALDPALAEYNPAAIVDLVVHSRLHAGAQTLYRRLAALEPGHFAVYDPATGAFATHRYWDYPARGAPMASAAAEADAFSALLEDAVRLRLRSDVPVGLTLSGGLDSSAVLAATRAVQGPNMRCFTSVYGADQRGEEAWAKIAANTANARLESVESPVIDWLCQLTQITDHLDGPGYSPAVFPLWSIMAHARAEGVPVLLEGQGADELLGGYPRYAAARIVDLAASGRLGDAAQSLRRLSQSTTQRWALGWAAREALPGAFDATVRRSRFDLFQPDITRGTPRAQARGPQDADRVFAALREDHASQVLPALLQYGDAVSMAHGVESRLPFMDYRLVEWVFARRPRLLEAGMSKAPVRAYLRSQGFQQIAERKDKQGYPTPIAHWMKISGNNYLRDIMASPSHALWGIFRRQRIERLTKLAEKGSQRALFHIYKILTIALWLDVLRQRSSAVARA